MNDNRHALPIWLERDNLIYICLLPTVYGLVAGTTTFPQ